MKLQTEVRMGVYIVSFDGELDMGTTEQLESVMTTILLSNTLKGIIFNFAKLEFVDSTGVGKLLSYFQELMARNLPFCLIELTQEVQEVFEILGLPFVIGQERFQKNLDEALVYTLTK
jgi:stage II sporulation protein AA (anti-sigma F factor antagonist)